MSRFSRSSLDQLKRELEDKARSLLHEMGDDVADAERQVRSRLAESFQDAAEKLAEGDFESATSVAESLRHHLEDDVEGLAAGAAGGAARVGAAAAAFLADHHYIHESIVGEVEHELSRIAKTLATDVDGLGGGSIAEFVAEVAALVVLDAEGRRWLPRVLLRVLDAPNAPGVPLVGLKTLIGTILRLSKRTAALAPAHAGLSDTYTIQGQTHPGYTFLFGGSQGAANEVAADHVTATLKALDPDGPTHDAVRAAREIRFLLEAITATPAAPAPPAAGPSAEAAPTTLALDAADQWTLGWTRYAGIRERALEPRLLLAAPADAETADGAAPPRSSLAATFAGALDPADPQAASRAFWPTLATYSVPYNLLILEKVTPGQIGDLRNLFGAAWDDAWAAAADAGDLYQIDLRLFEGAASDAAHNRTTPATVTLLQRSGSGPTWALTPVAVRVSTAGGGTCYREADGAWVWALQAARASATTFGIWIGHVYHWHIVTAAALQALPAAIADPERPTEATHPVGQILAPQGQWLREFDEALLALWSGAAPPTSFGSAASFLRLLSTYAAGRSFFADDPIQTLEANGFGDTFTTDTPTPADEDWRAHFPTARAYLEVWGHAQDYVAACVDAWYPSDDAVADDKALQAWLTNARSPNGGNLHGLADAVTTRDYLARLLTSLVYRVTVHGVGRLLSTANPGLSFVANFPPCLQPPTPGAAPPAPGTSMTAEELFAWMPRTGTIGGMFNFYGTFSFSEPYEPFIPFDGVDQSRFVARSHATPKGAVEASNQALTRFRIAIRALIDQIASPPAPGLPPRYQWPLSIET